MSRSSIWMFSFLVNSLQNSIDRTQEQTNRASRRYASRSVIRESCSICLTSQFLWNKNCSLFVLLLCEGSLWFCGLCRRMKKKRRRRRQDLNSEQRTTTHTFIPLFLRLHFPTCLWYIFPSKHSRIRTSVSFSSALNGCLSSVFSFSFFVFGELDWHLFFFLRKRMLWNWLMPVKPKQMDVFFFSLWQWTFWKTHMLLQKDS